jgi:hypothetical protein
MTVMPWSSPRQYCSVPITGGTGIGNIIEAVLIGILLMLFYRRSAALWPVVLGHYVTDIVDFAL